MKTTIIRDTNNSFIQKIERNNLVFSRKIEKQSPEYSNACMMFHKNGVEIMIGNKITF